MIFATELLGNVEKSLSGCRTAKESQRKSWSLIIYKTGLTQDESTIIFLLLNVKALKCLSQDCLENATESK